MGNLLEAHCSCGYAVGDLAEGCGMSGPESCRDLARCDHCQEFVSIRSSNSRRRCPRCRRKVFLVTVESAKRLNPQVTSEFERVQCPRCGKLTAELTMVGIWD